MTQLDSSIGLGLESTYGTPVTVTKFLEFESETFQWQPTFLQGQGLRVGSRVARAPRRSTGKIMAGGDLTVDAPTKGLGVLLKAAFGNVTSTQRATTGVYQHNFTPITGDYLPSYTIQKGIPRLGAATTDTYTFPGATVANLEISCATEEIVKVKTGWTARDAVRNVAYAAPSYPTPFDLFTFVGGTLTIGGTVTAATTTALATGGTDAANVRDITITYDNALDDGGFTFGGGGKRRRNPAVGLSPITGTMTVEYDATVMRDAYMDQTDLDLVLTFLGPTIIGTGSDVAALQVRIPNINLEGELPNASNQPVITTSVGFTGLDPLGGLAPISVSYVSTDVTP